MNERLCGMEKLQRQLKIQKLHIDNIKTKMKDKLLYNYLIEVNNEVSESNVSGDEHKRKARQQHRWHQKGW